ncbi:MAG: M20/M25/M40 family metallo-hydrolase [Acidobacteriota bacterium]
MKLKHLIAFCLLGSCLASNAAAAEPEATTWITIGSDAFGTLQEGIDVTRGQQPLIRYGERSEVILTQVPTRSLADISAKLHSVYHRCGGFMAHTSLQQAQAALESSGNVQRGAPIVYTLDQQETVERMSRLVREAPILATMESLSTEFNNRFHAHPSGTLASQWIRDQWQGYAAARPDVTVELVSHSGLTNQPSVVLSIPGTTLPGEVIVLGAHLDSIAGGSSNPDFLAPGADDDASGIAVLSEIIRVAMADDFRPQRTVRFMGYAAEEIGLVGSQDIAGDYRSDGVEVVAVMQFDLAAFQGSTEDIGLLSDFTNNALTTFATELIETYQPDLLWASTACGYACSDHASWHNQGFPAVMPTEARFGQHNQTIHTTSDTVATLNNSAAHAAKFARLGVAFTVEIGIDGLGSEIFANGFEEGSTGGWSTASP